MNKEQHHRNKYPQDANSQLNYISWDSTNAESKKIAFEAYSETLTELGYTESSRQPYSDLDPYASSRPGLARYHYESMRPDESVPKKIEDIIFYSDKIYREVGIIRNIIDLMGDFACQGVRLSHKDKRIEKFYKNWYKKVEGKERSERFLNYLFRVANVVIQRQSVDINLKQRARLFKTSAALEMEEVDIVKNNIPIKYNFLHPCNVEVVGGKLATFSNKKRYAFKMPKNIMAALNTQSEETKDVLKNIPAEIRDAIIKGTSYPLPEDSTLVFHYKKDDWENWACPIIYSIAKDIVMLDKLKLCDIAALDGAISNIRIFKLGSLEHGIAPGPGMAAKLKEMLKKHVGGGTIDLVWGPDIELLESKTAVHQFLGPAKYEPTLNNIFGGMGIPQSLTGFGGGGTTNNFISLKTLIQRLKYAREVLISFWEKEIAIVQEAMGFAEPAEIEFDYPDLGDSDSEKALLVQLADRNLISNELLRQRFGHNNTLEESRINTEYQAVEAETAPPKYGPYVNGEPEQDLEKIALQLGTLTPEQVGVEPKFGKSQKPIALRQPQNSAKPKGQPQQGRPKTSKDKVKRKTKTFKPKSKASLEIWAKDAQAKIAKMLYNPILESTGKSNIRELTVEEHNAAEELKFDILLRLEPMENITNESVAEAFACYQEDVSGMHGITMFYKQTLKEVSDDLDRQLTLAEARDIQTKIYTDLIMETYYED